MLVILDSRIFKKIIESFPHNHWIITPQWLDHLTTIGSFRHKQL